ncbi:MAG: class I SAM-dependent methyltransferase [Actinobacteria bacterium]|nr:class I SAM-dependent methyltransferase [Actinomycetota bacterium]
MEQNSSSHFINADSPLGRKSKLKWLFFNLRDNMASSHLKIEPEWFPRESFDNLAILNKHDSPSRNLCNLFWSQLNFKDLLDKPKLRLLEVGCGSGRYAKILRELGHDFFYVGIDVVPSQNWKTVSDQVQAEFFLDSATNVSKYLEDVDVVITQSALEHIENDVSLFLALKEHSDATRQTLVSVNLVPSPNNLALAPWHGIRQYGRATTSKILHAVGDNVSLRVILLGGLHSSWFQFRELTLRSLLGKTSSIGTDDYAEGLKKVIMKDAKSFKKNDFKGATFLAFILVFNPK